MQVEALRRFLEEKDATYGVIFCHHNADPDALFASKVFSKLLKKLKPSLKCDIVAPQGPSSLSTLLMNEVPVAIMDEPKLEKADFIALVDTSTTKQLDRWAAKVERCGKPIIIVDHHTVHPKTEKTASLMIVDREALSACEVVYSLWAEAEFAVNKKDALALFLGILFETKGLRYASTRTFRTVSELAETKFDTGKAFRMFSAPLSRSERFARLKAASRIEVWKIGSWILASSQVTSYEASAARGFLMLGADVAVVGGGKKGELRMSLRSTSDFFKKTGIHLGRDVAIALGEKFSGMGGGHPTSAGVNGYGDAKDAISEAVKILRVKSL